MQVLALRLRAFGQLAQGCIDTGRRRAEAIAHPLDAGGQARHLDRLQHVVDGAGLEGLDRMLVVGGHEDHVRLAAELAGDVEPGELGHLDVEEHDRGRLGFDELKGTDAVAGDPHDLQVGPQCGERILQLGGEHRLVLGDHGGDRLACAGGALRTHRWTPG